jgi:hypothetical protein
MPPKKKTEDSAEQAAIDPHAATDAGAAGTSMAAAAQAVIEKKQAERLTAKRRDRDEVMAAADLVGFFSPLEGEKPAPAEELVNEDQTQGQLDPAKPVTPARNAAAAAAAHQPAAAAAAAAQQPAAAAAAAAAAPPAAHQPHAAAAAAAAQQPAAQRTQQLLSLRSPAALTQAPALTMHAAPLSFVQQQNQRAAQGFARAGASAMPVKEFPLEVLDQYEHGQYLVVELSSMKESLEKNTGPILGIAHRVEEIASAGVARLQPGAVLSCAASRDKVTGSGGFFFMAPTPLPDSHPLKRYAVPRAGSFSDEFEAAVFEKVADGNTIFLDPDWVSLPVVAVQRCRATDWGESALVTTVTPSGIRLKSFISTKLLPADLAIGELRIKNFAVIRKDYGGIAFTIKTFGGITQIQALPLSADRALFPQ